VAFQPLDLLTMIGFIMMIGIIVNHSILLVDRTRDALNHGHTLEGSVAHGAEPAVARDGREHAHRRARRTADGVESGPASTIYRGLAAVNVAGVIVSMVFSIVLLPTLLRLMYERSVPVESTEAVGLKPDLQVGG
jgi:multidrug efflux pump subunit AcrB